MELRKELATLRLRIETLDGDVRHRDEEIKRLTQVKLQMQQSLQMQQNQGPSEERIKVSLTQDGFLFVRRERIANLTAF